MSNLGPNFYNKLIQISSEVGMKPEDILNVMALESGINPTAHNSNGNASGLVQFMPATLKGLGFQGSHADFRNLSGEQQLDYVKKWIEGLSASNGGPLKSAVQYYIGNFVPAALKIPGVRSGDLNAIICSKNPTEPHIPGVSTKLEAIYYKNNPVLDYDKDGNITVGDIKNILDRVANTNNFKMALNDLKRTGYEPTRQYEKSSQPSMVAKNTPNTTLNSYLGSMKGMTPEFDSILNSYLSKSAKIEKELYKKYLPKNNILISIASNDYINSIEFSRILRSALDTELLSESNIYTDGKNVEVLCKISGPKKECFYSVKEIVSLIKEEFLHATKKIGNLDIKTKYDINKKSSYSEISLEEAEDSLNKFLSKFEG